MVLSRQYVLWFIELELSDASLSSLDCVLSGLFLQIVEQRDSASDYIVRHFLLTKNGKTELQNSYSIHLYVN